MNDAIDPEEGDRVTPVPEGDPEWPDAWRASAQGCWDGEDDE